MSTTTDGHIAHQIDAHYGDAALGARILAALRAAGHDPDQLRWQDLAPVDQFHTRGSEATLELARLAGLTRDDAVLDVGGGIGGPARTLAATVGCRVTVLDLTESYCQAGAMLTERAGLADRVTFRAGSALAMPCEDASVDVVWTQHSSMNMEDKSRLYAECRRVVRPGGRFALHEIFAGPVAPLHFPVPWAFDPAISFVRPAAWARDAIAAAGFRERVWEDVTAQTLAWIAERAAASVSAAAAGTAPPLGLALLLGPRFSDALRTLGRNLAEGRAVVVAAVFDAA